MQMRISLFLNGIVSKFSKSKAERLMYSIEFQKEVVTISELKQGIKEQVLHCLLDHDSRGLIDLLEFRITYNGRILDNDKENISSELREAAMVECMLPESVVKQMSDLLAAVRSHQLKDVESLAPRLTLEQKKRIISFGETESTKMVDDADFICFVIEGRELPMSGSIKTMPNPRVTVQVLFSLIANNYEYATGLLLELLEKNDKRCFGSVVQELYEIIQANQDGGNYDSVAELILKMALQSPRQVQVVEVWNSVLSSCNGQQKNALITSIVGVFIKSLGSSLDIESVVRRLAVFLAGVPVEATAYILNIIAQDATAKSYGIVARLLSSIVERSSPRQATQILIHLKGNDYLGELLDELFKHHLDALVEGLREMDDSGRSRLIELFGLEKGKILLERVGPLHQQTPTTQTSLSQLSFLATNPASSSSSSSSSTAEASSGQKPSNPSGDNKCVVM